MILFIDTSDFHDLRLALIDPVKKSVKETRFAVAYNENYKTAEFLDKFLKKNKVAPKNLKKIIVCSGPGAFTGIRVGMSLAQGLGFGLNIPVTTASKNKIPDDLTKLAKLKPTKKLALHYGREANITSILPV